MSGSGRDDRTARLAEALRENLRRRKAQARSRRDADGTPRQAEPALHEPAGNEAEDGADGGERAG